MLLIWRSRHHAQSTEEAAFDGDVSVGWEDPDLKSTTKASKSTGSRRASTSANSNDDASTSSAPTTRATKRRRDSEDYPSQSTTSSSIKSRSSKTESDKSKVGSSPQTPPAVGNDPAYWRQRSFKAGKTDILQTFCGHRNVKTMVRIYVTSSELCMSIAYISTH